MYTEKLDASPPAGISAAIELRPAIEKPLPVTLGKMNKLLEDEVDALVGVPSNVPPTILVGCLLEIYEDGLFPNVSAPFVQSIANRTARCAVWYRTLGSKSFLRLATVLDDADPNGLITTEKPSPLH